ncbi:DedA family protein [Actinoplanes sp. NPDC051851]|uniref:DedA family protein n=1 Tax=Actinoplanes sp. NPDC051851 TaxID=3154753 RepID=UPI003415B26B
MAQLDGLAGWVASVIDALGEVGVGLLIALENLIPPVPSEIVLSMAGYLASEGRVGLVPVWLAATLGSLAGALLLYALGRGLGEDRLYRWLDRIPLVDPADLRRADRWFERHERAAVLFGRCAPVVRSLVSIPAGANRMPVGRFTVCTAIGSGLWNAIFIGAGYALGSRWQDVERYGHWFDYGVGAIAVLMIGSWVVTKLRGRHARRPRSGERVRSPR